jgi:PTS system N-acetylglucosamine-specific IIC component
MYRAAPPENRKGVGGMLLSMGLTSFLTGVTEPIEFSFMFLAPELYALHAILTGVSCALMNALGVRLGFTFSAGAIDYVLSYGLATKGWLLLPVGAVYFAVYYGVFLFCIRRFRLATPGREASRAEPANREEQPLPAGAGGGAVAAAYVRALGGAANLLSVDACTTRLRLLVADSGLLDEAALRALGAKAVIRPAPGSVQVVLGPEADRVAALIRTALGAALGPEHGTQHGTQHGPEHGTQHGPGTAAAPAPSSAAPPVAPPAAPSPPDAAEWLSALGGSENVVAIEAVATTRLRVQLANTALLDAARLRQLGALGVMNVRAALAHIVVGRRAADLASQLQAAAAVAPKRTTAPAPAFPAVALADRADRRSS